MLCAVEKPPAGNCQGMAARRIWFGTVDIQKETAHQGCGHGAFAALVLLWGSIPHVPCRHCGWSLLSAEHSHVVVDEVQKSQQMPARGSAAAARETPASEQLRDV